MKAAQSNIIPFPLPSKINAKTNKELDEKVKSLLHHHDCFFATLPIDDGEGNLTTYLTG